MAQGIDGGGGGKDPKSKIGQMMQKIKGAASSKKGSKSGDSAAGSMFSGMANSAKGPDLGE